MKQPSTDGFTLLELSIVLVVISLITASIVVGRDLIRLAEIRQQIAQIESFNTVANTFRVKYNCLPGDCASAVELGFGAIGGPGDNGNGDGKIHSSEAVGTICISAESINFWYHLAQAKMLNAVGDFQGYAPGTPFPDNYPGILTPHLILKSRSLIANSWSNPKGGLIVINLLEFDRDPMCGGLVNFSALHDERARNFWFFTTTMETLASAPGVWLPETAYAMDVKIDDGMPRMGNMRSISGKLSAWNVDGCVDKTVTPYEYAITRTDVTLANYANLLCAPIIATTF